MTIENIRKSVSNIALENDIFIEENSDGITLYKHTSPSDLMNGKDYLNRELIFSAKLQLDEIGIRSTAMSAFNERLSIKVVYAVQKGS